MSAVKFHVPGASQPLPFKVVVDAHQKTLVFSAQAQDQGRAVQSPTKKRNKPGVRTMPVTEASAQYYRENFSTYTVGVETIEGTALITLNLDEVRGLVMRAARNKNGRSQEGPVQVKFTGSKTFTPEVQK